MVSAPFPYIHHLSLSLSLSLALSLPELIIQAQHKHTSRDTHSPPVCNQKEKKKQALLRARKQSRQKTQSFRALNHDTCNRPVSHCLLKVMVPHHLLMTYAITHFIQRSAVLKPESVI